MIKSRTDSKLYSFRKVLCNERNDFVAYRRVGDRDIPCDVISIEEEQEDVQ
ncbi:MAG: hypothetical protein QXP36_03330 [Conexivisphaerales archaeon]